MRINFKSLMVLLFGGLLLFSLPTTTIHAESQTVPLAVLKDGTDQTSYAASYFAHSATVASDGNGVYTVTSTITTSKKLGNYPVQILNIDGAGANVSKSDNGSSQTITYSFQTNDLNRRHNSVIKVDVNNINYHHVYNVGLKLDASSIKQDTPKAKEQSDASQTNPKASSTKDANTAETADTKAKDNASDSSSDNASVSSSRQDDSQPAASSTDNSSSNNNDTNFFKKVGAVVGSGLGVGVIAAVGTIWYTSRKK